MRLIRTAKKYAGTVGALQLLQIALAKITGKRRVVRFRHRLLRHPFYLRVPSADNFVFKQILMRREYDIAFAGAVRTVIDAGANIGLSSAFFASRYPDAKIIALEPEPGNFAMLQKNAAPYGNIIAERAALWREETELRLSDPGRGEWGFTVGADGEGEKTPAVTVDGIMRRHNIGRLSVLKADIEGAEREVFSGAPGWTEFVDAVVVELHDRVNPGCGEAVAAALKDFGEPRRVGENFIYARPPG